MRVYCARADTIASPTAAGMRSGRLCSSGGRHCTSMSDQALSRFSATISRASAPQAMISTGAALIAVASMTRRATRGDERLGGLHGNRGIAAIGVGADGPGEFLVERRTANQHDV